MIGWPSDVSAITKAQADEFYALYYSGQNITLMLVGDFKADEAAAMAEKYFGRIPHGKTEPPEVITLEVPQPAEKRMYAEADTNPQVDIVWHTVPFGHRDTYPLDILSQILSTRTGRLYKGLVLGSQAATDVSAAPIHRKWAGLFDISADASPGQKPEAVEQAIYAELEKLRTQEVPPEELQKVKNNFTAGEYRRLTGNMPILMQLMFNDGLGDWREVNEAGPKHQAVTAADVKRVVNTYFTKENRTVAIYTRKAGKPEVPLVAGLSAEEQSALRSLAATLKAESDARKTRPGAARGRRTGGQGGRQSQSFIAGPTGAYREAHPGAEIIMNALVAHMFTRYLKTGGEEIRIPKAEIRKKSEARNPKGLAGEGCACGGSKHFRLWQKSCRTQVE